MQQTCLIRDAALLAVAGAVGWWAHGGGARVQAASDATVVYQFESLKPESALTLYNPDERTLYVYQGATAGSSHLNCSYRYRIPRAGAPIDRENCSAGSLLR